MTRRLGATFVCAVLFSGLSGCDEEPTCSLTTSFEGAYAGPIEWRLSGNDSCGVVDPNQVDPNSSILAFIDRSTGIAQQVYVLPKTPVPNVGTYPGRVMFVVADNLWDSGDAACTVQIDEFVLEDWSITDFVRIKGIVVCPTPLASASPDLGEVTMGALEFSGHLYDERYDLDLN